MLGLGLFLFGLGVILVIVAPIGKRKNNRCSAQTQRTLNPAHHRDIAAFVSDHSGCYLCGAGAR